MFCMQMPSILRLQICHKNGPSHLNIAWTRLATRWTAQMEIRIDFRKTKPRCPKRTNYQGMTVIPAIKKDLSNGLQWRWWILLAVPFALYQSLLRKNIGDSKTIPLSSSLPMQISKSRSLMKALAQTLLKNTLKWRLATEVQNLRLSQM